MFFLLILCFLTSITGILTNNITVRTKQGNVIGYRANDGNYFQFYDIPYAGSVSGKARFKGPSDPPKFNGDFKAVDRNILCAQPSPNGPVGVEDCLTLSVFTNDVTTKKPIFLWLHGEEYYNTKDMPRYSYKHLVEANSVFITLNYRLSIFGFLCFRIAEAPGNAGLKDVLKALEWIKNNAVNFGGDPDNVVLMGHGSGAAMVDLITLSPLSKNLVHKAITISGSGIASWAVAFDPENYARRFADRFGYPPSSNKQLAENFMAADANFLRFALNGFTFHNNSVWFAPCVEDKSLPGSVLTDAPINILKSGEYQKIPYISIYVEMEGSMRTEQGNHQQWLEHMQNNFTDFLPVDLKFKDEKQRLDKAKEVREFYFREKAIDVNTFDDFMNYEGDILAKIPVIRGVKARAVRTDNVYLLKFDLRNDVDDMHGTRHGAILNYIFYLESKPVEERARKNFVDRFVAFAMTGTPKGTTDPSDLVWPPFTRNGTKYLQITGQGTRFTQTPSSHPHNLTLEFWKRNLSRFYVSPEVNSGNMILNVGLLLLLCQAVLRVVY